VPSLSSLLLRIPDQFKPLAAVGIGSLILVALVLFHGIGLHRVMVQFKRAEIRLRVGRPHLSRAGFLFGWSVFLMLFLHILEITIWAVALVALGLVVRASDALYFCANAYTTLGYGAVDLDPHWRNISPIIAISGLFTLAWTTSSLVSIVSSYLKLVEQLELERHQQLNLRAAARIAEWNVLTSERRGENAERLEARKRVTGASFFERRRIWKAEREQAKQMRQAASQEIHKIREQESRDEDNLGEAAPQENSEANQ
jgi:signal transduction histidine kinase